MNIFKRYHSLSKLKRRIRCISRELSYYKEIDEVYECSTLASQRLDLLKHNRKLKDQYNNLKFKCMQELI